MDSHQYCHPDRAEDTYRGNCPHTRLMNRALQRDPVQSEKIAPRQWSFKQWATQSKEIREMAQEIKVDKAH